MSDIIKRYIRILILSVVGATFMTYLSCNSCMHDSKKFVATAFFTTVMWFTMWVGNETITHYINRKISWVKAPVKRLIVGVITTVIFTVIVSVGLAMSWEYTWKIRFNDYDGFIFSALIVTFLISLFFHGREFLMMWKQSAVEAERYQKESVMAQYQNLKSQVDPHFLFNSLNVLTNLVYEDADKSAKFIKQLSEVYRYVLDTKGKELVAIDEEMKFVNSYLFLQQIRFGDKLIIINQLNGRSGVVPPLVLQMLVENAIKHNIISEEHPLTIRIFAEGDTIVVENDLQRKTIPEGDSTGIGLDNTRKRYEFLSDRKMEVEELNGKFKVTIPLLKSHE
jgi:sensor histidine kinase YesM